MVYIKIAAPASSDNDTTTTLSSASIAGVVVGSVVATIIIVTVSLLWYRRRRKRLIASKADKDVLFEKPQLHSDCLPRPDPSELGNTEIVELPTRDPELVGTEVFHELSTERFDRNEEDSGGKPP